jgi:DNA repair exonuclease SbcCD ATPase subunit
MNAPEQQTCGKGLAENSVLPAKLGELIAAMAENLEAHMRALDLTDVNSKQEYEAYKDLVREEREIASQLAATAQEMARYRDLPMGRHDAKAMSHTRVREAFEKFVQRKKELLSLLDQTAERDNQLLEVMRLHGG